tara:strand:- start:1190 stop:3898 length:2709 start_codon:yes stop_codon:yes gene_type:complete
MNNKIINPLTGKYVNINSNEGREILNYYTNTNIDFLIGGNFFSGFGNKIPNFLSRKDKTGDSKGNESQDSESKASFSDSLKERIDSLKRGISDSTASLSDSLKKGISDSKASIKNYRDKRMLRKKKGKKCVAMNGLSGKELTPIKQSAKSVAHLYNAILQSVKHTAIPQIARISYHLLGKNVQARKMLIDERGKQKLCEAIRNQYNNLHEGTIETIRERLVKLIEDKANKKSENRTGGGESNYINDENFIELSHRLEKLTNILVHSYNAEGYTPEVRRNLNTLMYNTLENIASMHLVFEMHEQFGGDPSFNLFKKRDKSILKNLAERMTSEGKGTEAAYDAFKKTSGSLMNIAKRAKKDSGFNDLMKKMPGFDANAVASQFNQLVDPATGPEGLKSAMNKLNFKMPNVSSSKHGFLVGMLLPLYLSGMQLPWQMQEMAIRQFDQKLNLLNRCDVGLNRICALINQLINEYGCEKICQEIADKIDKVLQDSKQNKIMDDEIINNIVKEDDSVMKAAKKAKAFAKIGSDLVMEKASNLMGKLQLPIVNLKSIIPEDVLSSLIQIYFKELLGFKKNPTLTDVITAIADLQYKLDELDELSNITDTEEISEIKDKIKNVKDNIIKFFLYNPYSGLSEDNFCKKYKGKDGVFRYNKDNIKSVLHYYKLRLCELQDNKVFKSLKVIKNEIYSTPEQILQTLQHTKKIEIPENKVKKILEELETVKEGLDKIIELILKPIRKVLGNELINKIQEKLERLRNEISKRIKQIEEKIIIHKLLLQINEMMISNPDLLEEKIKPFFRASTLNFSELKYSAILTMLKNHLKAIILSSNTQSGGSEILNKEHTELSEEMCTKTVSPTVAAESIITYVLEKKLNSDTNLDKDDSIKFREMHVMAQNMFIMMMMQSL